MKNARATLYIVLSIVVPAIVLPSLLPSGVTACEYWVAPAGDDSNPGTAAAPWATLVHASEVVPDDYCTVWVEDGEYAGKVRINRRFMTPTIFRAVHDHRAVFHHDGLVLSLSGATNVTMDGFVFRHSSPAAAPLVVQVDGSAAGYGEYITLRNNIFHDSYNNDLLKIVSGARQILVENNVFYNQGPTDEHIDVNSVTDVIIQDNIFFNDYAGSGRANPATSHSFITIKDSDEGADGLLGSERITVRRNIFLNWEGGRETLIQVGNDGKPYHEARDVRIESNLFIGNSPNDAYSVLGLRGVRDVVFANNTAVGDFPSSAYAMWIDLKGLNPVNENVFFANNVWSDPTGSMGSYFMDNSDNEFSKGNTAYVTGATIDNNLYWNGPKPIPGGDLLVPLVDDARALVADPLLHTFYNGIVLPRWTGDAFLSGNASIREEFVRLADLYGRPATGSPAIGAADPALFPTEDLLGRPRSATPDLGAYEYHFTLTGSAEETAIHVAWTPPNESSAVSLTLIYAAAGVDPVTILGIPIGERDYLVTGLVPRTVYTLRLIAVDAIGATLTESDPLTLETTGHRWCLPFLVDFTR